MSTVREALARAAWAAQNRRMGLLIDGIKETCVHDEQNKCASKEHVKRAHKKWLLLVLVPWSALIPGLAFAIEAIAHLLGCHLGIGGF